ncbi:MAG: VanZ family protein [Lachnospiraceae bacterium]|nr:VanZ family protein [Lachnospiraceae bacterium]
MTKYIIKDLMSMLRFLPYGLIVGILATVILCAINDRRVKKQKKPFAVAAIVSYIMYTAIMLIITFWSRENGSSNGIDLELFSTWGINDRNNAYAIENILLFMPYGFLTAWVFPSMRNLFTCILLGLVSSLGIEYLQMITERGYFQIDDIITNTIGTVLGYVLFRCIWGIGKLFCKIVGKKKN